MTGWIICWVILLVLALFLFSHLSIDLYINESVKLKISYIGISLFSFDSTNTAKKKKEKPKKPKADLDGKSFVSTLKKYAASKKKGELVKELFGVFKLLLERFKKLVSKVKLRKFALDLSVGADDAAKTAVLYGEICSAVYPVLTFLSGCVDFSAENISIRTDFLSEEIKLKLSTVIKVRISSLFVFLVSSVFSLIKFKIGDLKNA
jgi:hypothetical protein